MQYQSECRTALKSVVNLSKPFEKTFMDEGVSKLPYSKKKHKALTFTSQGFAMSKSFCNFRP